MNKNNPVLDYELSKLVAESLYCTTKKLAGLNGQKIIEMLRQYWTVPAKSFENDLNIEFPLFSRNVLVFILHKIEERQIFYSYFRRFECVNVAGNCNCLLR